MSTSGAANLSRREALRITASVGLTLAFGAGVTGAILRQAGLHRVSVTRTQMGMPITVTIVHPERDGARTLVQIAFQEIERLESILSRHRPVTAVSRLNRAGIVHLPPPELTEVLRRAFEYSVMTEGAFDCTVAPLLDLYVDRYWRMGVTPVARDVSAALALVGYEGIRIEDSHIALQRPGMAVTLDGIAKGYILDRSVSLLAASGAERVLVEAGGDIGSTAVEAGAESWQVTIRDPLRSGGSLGTLALRGECVASSGGYLQNFSERQQLHHILDPRTGLSPDHTSAVTILAGSAMDADALSTAVFVTGPEAGLALLGRLPNVEGLIVTKGDERLTTSGFTRYLT